MTFLEQVCRALADADVDYAVVGGHAVALHGVVRHHRRGRRLGDLIDMKRRSGRAQDMADVEALRKQAE